MKKDKSSEVGLNDGNREEYINHNDVVKAKKLTFEDIREHMSGPVVSLMVHIVAIAFLSTLIVFKKPYEGKKLEIKELFVEIKHIKKIPDPPEVKEAEVEPDIEIERPDVIIAEQDVPVEDPVPVDVPAPNVVIPNILNIERNNSVKKMPLPVSYANRTASRRKVALKRYTNCGTRTERAVMKGLRWLKDHQNADGPWGDSAVNNKPAFTGFALLAFLAHGETPSAAEFGSTVLKAIKKLVEYEGQEGANVTGGYRHGIVMYALSEAYAVTSITMLESIVNKGTKKIIDGINSKGSFNYGYKNEKQRCDLSVAGWNYQALKAALAAGSTAEGLEACIDKSIDIGLKKTHAGKGGFSYGEGGSKKGTMTAVGTLCLQLFGEGKSAQAKTGLATLQEPQLFWVNWKGNNGKAPAWALYQWYYQTQAIFQGFSGKGSGWKKWNKMFTRELLRKQKFDGRWETPAFEYSGGKAKGHGEQAFAGLDQPVYATSLCVLMLEVYYRYLPTFKVAKHETPAVDTDDDLGLKIL
jgi:hypothetical protein